MTRNYSCNGQINQLHLSLNSMYRCMVVSMSGGVGVVGGSDDFGPSYTNIEAQHSFWPHWHHKGCLQVWKGMSSCSVVQKIQCPLL